MNLTELSARLGLETVAGSTEGKEWRGVYAGDLLSRAMSHVKMDNLWITIMSNTNVVAVASLTEAAAVILAEGVELIPEAQDAAEENGITVLSSKHSVFELCAAIWEAARTGA